MDGKYGGGHTGTVRRLCGNDRVGVSFGFIEDDDPGIEDDIFFRNYGGRFGPGDTVTYRLLPGDPSPVAKGVLPSKGNDTWNMGYQPIELD